MPPAACVGSEENAQEECGCDDHIDGMILSNHSINLIVRWKNRKKDELDNPRIKFDLSEINRQRI